MQNVFPGATVANRMQYTVHFTCFFKGGEGNVQQSNEKGDQFSEEYICAGWD